MRRSSPETICTSGSISSGERDAVLARPFAHHHDAPLDRLAQRERRHLQLDLARLHLRQVEHVIDQREEVVAGGADVLDVLPLLLVQLPEEPLLAAPGRSRESR